MPAERTFQGIGVSGGVAVAPLFLLSDEVTEDRSAGTPEEEREALRQALA